MAISASLVKELRERTGAGMMECKRALEATAGDIDAAIEQMRKAGMAKADKKAGRVAAEGVVFIQPDGTGRRVAMVEVNCETDFVAKGEDFQDFVKAVANSVLEGHPADEEDLNGKKLFGTEATTVEEARRALVAKIGENISVRRFAYVDAGDNVLGTYVHGAGRIGVVVVLEGGNEDLAKDVAMHAAAARPMCISAEQVPADVLDKEREIFAAQAKESGKPDNIIEKMVEGRIKKYLAEVTLLGQQFVKNPDVTVEQLLKDAGANVSQLYRFEVGEGIEKKVENFREEVMAQVHGG